MRCLLVGVYFVVAMTLAAPTSLGDDAAIARKVAEKLRFKQEQKALKGFHITVKVEDNTVWMMGNVANADQRDLALDAARRVKDVRLVVNDLDVASEAALDDQPQLPAASDNGTAGSDQQAREVDQSIVRQAAAVSQVAPQSRPVGPPMIARMPVGSGVQYAPGQSYGPAPVPAPRYTSAPTQPQPVRVAQLPGACYDGSCNAGGGYAGGGYVDGGGYAGGGYAGGGGVQDGGYGVSSGQPQMPNHAWPAYASYPNYGAVSYPKQYSPKAWPYIGPFYPYPQVPLGWRKVSLEWDDGWWMLDFSSK